MATGRSLLQDDTPTSVYIESNQLQKSANVCKFENCTNLRKGYSDFCRKHKAVGRIISGRIAREKAIAKIAERDTENQVSEVNRTQSQMQSEIKNYIPQDKSYSDVLFRLLGTGFIAFTWYIILTAESITPSMLDRYLVAALATLFFGSLLIFSTAKSLEARWLVGILMIIFIPITLFMLFILAVFNTGGGGCYGVCGLSGWGGP